MSPPLSPDALERIFAALSEAIDRTGPERAPLLLARLALLLAGVVGDEERVLALVKDAEQSVDR
jgi:hypothetical protein